MNKTQLQTNNTRLASLITELRGKATGGGGASMETCSISVTEPNGMGLYISYTALSDGAITAHVKEYCAGETITLENVVCGSLISGSYISGGLEGTPEVGGGVVLNSNRATSATMEMLFTAPTTAGATGSIVLYESW